MSLAPGYIDGLGINAKFNVPKSPQFRYSQNQLQAIVISDANNNYIRQMNMTSTDYPIISLIPVTSPRGIKFDSMGIYLYVATLTNGILRINIAHLTFTPYTSGKSINHLITYYSYDSRD